MKELIPEDHNEVIETGMATTTPTGLSTMPRTMPTAYQSRREHKFAVRVASRLESRLVVEQNRTVLAQCAMGNLATLSTLASHLVEVSPLGEAEYRKILEAYATRAAEEVICFGGQK